MGWLGVFVRGGDVGVLEACGFEGFLRWELAGGRSRLRLVGDFFEL